MFCASCGAEQNDTAKFCMACGSKLKSNAEQLTIDRDTLRQRDTVARTKISGLSGRKRPKKLSSASSFIKGALIMSVIAGAALIYGNLNSSALNEDSQPDSSTTKSANNATPEADPTSNTNDELSASTSNSNSDSVLSVNELLGNLQGYDGKEVSVKGWAFCDADDTNPKCFLHDDSEDGTDSNDQTIYFESYRLNTDDINSLNHCLITMNRCEFVVSLIVDYQLYKGSYPLTATQIQWISSPYH